MLREAERCLILPERTFVPIFLTYTDFVPD